MLVKTPTRAVVLLKNTIMGWLVGENTNKGGVIVNDILIIYLLVKTPTRALYFSCCWKTPTWAVHVFLIAEYFRVLVEECSFAEWLPCPAGLVRRTRKNGAGGHRSEAEPRGDG
jgi:hypothetical protein